MNRERDLSRLLDWYPREWRDRYGDELIVLMEDTLGDDQPGPGLRWSIARSGLTERARAGGWAGDSASPHNRVRAGALIVLCGWTALVIAGAAFAKVSEHFDTALLQSSGTLAVVAWRTVEVGAVVASIAVLLGAVVALPAVRRAWRNGGCRDLRGHLVRAVTATSTAVASTAALIVCASTLSASERETAAWPYALAFICWAALLVLCLVSWSALAIGAARRVTFTRTELAAESVLAVAVAAGMAVITVATTLWWREIATDAPWFLHGAPPGTPSSAFDVRLVAIATVMTTALAAAVHGVVRIARSWFDLAAA